MHTVLMRFVRGCLGAFNCRRPDQVSPEQRHWSDEGSCHGPRRA